MQTRYFDLRDTKGPQKEIEDKIAAAAKILREGGLLGIPTETVYGLGANALDGAAVKRIFEAKGRPQDNPLIIHVTGAQWLPRYCEDVPPLAYVLARKFWPGPLTMILKRKSIIPDETTAGLDTVGVRCPSHPVTLSIIREAGVPIAAPSANLSGRPSCTTAQDVLEDMDGRISGVVDGGPCTVGVESTILDLPCDPPRLLRPGGLPLEDLERLIGRIVDGTAGARDLVALAAGLWILVAVADGLGAVLALMRQLAGQAGLSEALLEPVVKTVALSILTRVTAEICRAAGEGGTAAFVETAGAVLALVAVLPLVRAVAQLMGELLG